MNKSITKMLSWLLFFELASSRPFNAFSFYNRKQLKSATEELKFIVLYLYRKNSMEQLSCSGRGRKAWGKCLVLEEE